PPPSPKRSAISLDKRLALCDHQGMATITRREGSTMNAKQKRRRICILPAWVLWTKFTPLGATDESQVKWQLIGAKTLETQCRQEAAHLQGRESRFGVDGDRRYGCLPAAPDH